LLKMEFKHHKPNFGRGREHMVVGFTTTCAISGYHNPLKL
jgi:hypothetical protein